MLSHFLRKSNRGSERRSELIQRHLIDIIYDRVYTLYPGTVYQPADMHQGIDARRSVASLAVSTRHCAINVFLCGL